MACIEDIPFVRAAWPYTDSVAFPGVPPVGSTTATVTIPKPGTVCMSGTVNDGFASLTLSFVPADDVVRRAFYDPAFDATLHATDLGITQIRFTIDSPPPGTQVQLRSVLPNCGAQNCMRGDFYLSGGEPPAPLDIAAGAAGVATVTAPIARFAIGPGPNPDWTLDANHLAWFHVGPGSLAQSTGAYAYCVHDFELLDAQGHAVRPSPPVADEPTALADARISD